MSNQLINIRIGKYHLLLNDGWENPRIEVNEHWDRYKGVVPYFEVIEFFGWV